MTRRWFIRGIFIGLLLLCVSGWAISYKYGSYLACMYGRDRWLVGCNWGHVVFDQLRNAGTVQGAMDGGPAGIYPARNYAFPEYYKQHNYIMAHVVNDQNVLDISVPIWSPTILFAALLWLVWRKTRPKIDPKKAFPMDAKQAT